MKKFKKAVLTAILAEAILTSGLASCTMPPPQIDVTVESEYSDFVPAKNETDASNKPQTGNPSASENQNEFISIEELAKNPDCLFFKNWAGTPYLCIDERTLYEIVRATRQEVEDLFVSIGGGNPMTLDSNGQSIPGANFYPEWFDDSFLMARAKREGSPNLMVNFVNTKENSQGITALIPEEVKPTLEQYFKSIFNKDFNFTDMEILPRESDVNNISSYESRVNILHNVKNNLFLSTCYSVEAVKNLNYKNHPDYYGNKYNEETRMLAAIADYPWSHSSVVSALRNGSFYENMASGEYVQTFLQFQKEFQQKYGSNDFENQMQ